jgi:hypothetical protein
MIRRRHEKETTPDRDYELDGYPNWRIFGREDITGDPPDISREQCEVQVGSDGAFLTLHTLSEMHPTLIRRCCRDGIDQACRHRWFS